MGTEQLAVHSECDVRPFAIAQHLPKVLVQAGQRDDDRVHLVQHGAGLDHDCEHAPDREAVPVEVRQALLFRSKSSSYFVAVLLVANSLISSSYIERSYCVCETDILFYIAN